MSVPRHSIFLPDFLARPSSASTMHHALTINHRQEASRQPALHPPLGYQEARPSFSFALQFSLLLTSCSFKRATRTQRNRIDKLRIPKVMTDVAAVVAAAATSRGIGYNGQLVSAPFESLCGLVALCGDSLTLFLARFLSFQCAALEITWRHGTL